jgi:DNA polymerase-3 subunit epsilon
MPDRLLFIDTETGGLDPNKHSLLSLAMVIWEDMEIIDSQEILINDGILSATKEALSINKIDLEKHKQSAISSDEAFDLFDIKVEGRHTALGDAIATATLFTKLLYLIK